MYGDREIAEAVFELTLRVAQKDNSPDLLAMSPYFTRESIDLFREGLLSSDANIRTWSVWQLRKTGYELDEAELEKLFNDKSWKVQANAAQAGGKDVVAICICQGKNIFKFLTQSLKARYANTQHPSTLPD